jgi:hypothetical protein
MVSLVSMATRTDWAAGSSMARFVITVSGPADGSIAKSWGKLTDELQKTRLSDHVRVGH